MSAALVAGVVGIGAFTTGLPDWPAVRAMLRREPGASPGKPSRPAAAVLPAAERRRAPDGVRLAVEVAAQACRMAARDPATLPCFFASAQGEAGITDYVCATLARRPLELSPTKFHNSVLNAAAGYWTIATRCTAPSSAISAADSSVAAGLFEAAVFACAEHASVLFAACDVAASGPLAEPLRTRVPFGMALVLDPGAQGVRVRLTARPARGDAPIAAPPWPTLAGHNPTAAQALPLLAMLAGDDAGSVILKQSRGVELRVERPA